MIDIENREKVIQGLTICGSDYGVPDICSVMECPYRNLKPVCNHVLASDALSVVRVFVPKKLITDGGGGAYCPNCKNYITDYHPAYDNELDGPAQKHCENCGQALIWEIDDE